MSTLSTYGSIEPGRSPTIEARTRRCFIALPLDEACIGDLTDFMQTVRIEGMRPTRPENMHLTLKFLGDVEDSALPELMNQIRDAVASSPAFELEVTGAVFLPDTRRARVFAAECQLAVELARLFNVVEDVTAACGFRREGRAYHPHITLGRFRRPPRRLPRGDELALPVTGCRIEQIVLLQSDLAPGGAVYTSLAQFPLASESSG